jgi:hypothetical protein
MKGPIMRKSLSLLFLFAAAAAFAGEGRPLVSVKLNLPHAVILPGVPFDLSVTYQNLSDRPVAAGALATMIISTANGTPVRLESPAHVDHLGLRQSRNFELQPGETQTGTVNWHSNWFYDDAAFTVPGTYQVAIELTGDASDAEGEGLAYAGTIRTLPVRLTRVEPTDEDAEVWKLLREAASGSWPSHGFGSRATAENMADVVVAHHRRSAYYPYALLLGHAVPTVSLETAREAVSAFQSSPAYPHLLVTAAIAAHVEARKRQERHAPAPEVEGLLRMSVELAESAVRTGNPAVRAQANVNEQIARDYIDRLRREAAKRE